MISIAMMILQFYEVSQLDKYMITENKSRHMGKKSAAACESSSESDMLSTSSESEIDDYPDWRVMLKNVEGNHHLHK